MDFVIPGVALVVGIGIGYGIALALAKRESDNTPAATGSTNTDWWNIRQALTGT